MEFVTSPGLSKDPGQLQHHEEPLEDGRIRVLWSNSKGVPLMHEVHCKEAGEHRTILIF